MASNRLNTSMSNPANKYGSYLADQLALAKGGNPAGTTYYVNADPGDPGLDTADGLTPQTAFLTMGKALSVAETLDTIYFWGDVREELTGNHLVFDLTIVGLGSLHHPDSPAAGYQVGSSMWRPPASPTAATPLLKLRGRGWKFINVAFDCPVDAAAVKMERNALSGTSEYDPSHASFYGCRFVDGKYGIEDNGGCYNVTVEECEFKAMTTAAIANTSTSVANPLNWKITNNRFPSNVSSFGNATHIDSPLNCAHIRHNVFGTVTSTALYIDLTGGNGNVAAYNVLAGAYDTSDYVSGTGDVWYQNACAVTTTTAPDGVSILPPAA
jgi:hypothetical protein